MSTTTKEEEKEEFLKSFSVNLSYQGQIVTLDNMTIETTGKEIDTKTREVFSIPDSNHVELKLLFMGKKLNLEDDSSSSSSRTSVFLSAVPNKEKLLSLLLSKKKNLPKIIVISTNKTTISTIANQRSDPLIRGFDKEQQQQQQAGGGGVVGGGYWGKYTMQDKNYRFCKIQACDWQSFGHRPSDRPPHEFQARRLLERLATDPGIVAIMKERELVVNTLGEMDPIDDRIMQKHQAKGGCLLGYNTNRGLRIEIKLRTDDLQDFRPYQSLVTTLIHELSHNWVGEHNLLFWTNFAQMRAEYLYWHFHHTSDLIQGKTTADLAGLQLVASPSSSSNSNNNNNNNSIFQSIMKELVRDMKQHNLHPNSIAVPIKQRCDELEESYKKGKRLGGGAAAASGDDDDINNSSNNNNNKSIRNGDQQQVRLSTRELALRAAERRRQEQQNKD